MSIGPLGIIGGIAASPQSQRVASADRAATESVRQAGEASTEQSATDAAGIGKTEGDEQTAGERDADGRLDWQRRNKRPDLKESLLNPDASEPIKSKDVTGNCGGALDLEG